MSKSLTAASSTQVGAASESDDCESRTARVERLYREHRELVYKLALRYGGGNTAWAEDVTQEVFVRLFDVVMGLEPRDTLAGWFYRVTTNRCLNRLRRERFRSSPWIRWLVRRSESADVDPERRVVVRDQLEQAWDVVQTLSPKERVAFCMHYVDGKRQVEIAAILGHSKGYVCKLLKRAEARVRAAGWEVEA
jgi:RNA polymerase sigma-70 factor (ECF subfamily)